MATPPRQTRAGEVPGQYASYDDVPKGRPTPTQDELNAINLGEAPDIAPDGSGPDPHNQPVQGSVVGATQPKAQPQQGQQPARPVTHTPPRT